VVVWAIHALSPHAGRPFIPVNCAAISKELIESELFGHGRGAFTGAIATHKGAFEEADGGTLPRRGRAAPEPRPSYAH
jgi:transcriptional regulator with GAF, ATPase, and Fis domain